MKKNDKEKNQEQLINKLMKLHQRITEVEKSGNNKKLQEEYLKFKQDEEFLRGSEEQFRILVEMSIDAIFLETTEGRILECNVAGAKMFGYTKEEMIGLTIADLVSEEFAKLLPKVITEKETTHGIFVPRINKKKDGTLFPTEIATKLVNIRGESRLIAYIRDITGRKKNEKLQGVLYNISKAANSNISLDQLYPLIHKELGTIIDATNFFIALIDVEKDEMSFPYHKDEKDNDFPTRRLSRANNLTAYIIRSGQSLQVNQKQIEKMADEGDIKLESIGIVTAGIHWLGVPLKIKNKIIGAMVVQGYINPHLFSKKDIQLMEFVSSQVATAIQGKQMEEEMEKLAHFDGLTGAFNRGYGLGLLSRELKFARRRKTPFLLVYIDVDDFKNINDTFGHGEGDQVLKKVVKLLKSTLRDVDIICRMGGDEFLLIFPESSFNDVPLIRERLDKNLEKLNQTLNKSYNIGFSIGISCYDPDRPQSIDELISIADKNMYKEKKKKSK
jgi:diguanylate cyclase (GGDEF)-like protein/PAS domain S-box-containing protein